MFIMYALLSFFFWGIADLFYKKGNSGEGKYNHIKTGIIVGIVMGIHATIYLIIHHVQISFLDVIKYLPVSAFYISSMVIGYKGLKFIELSISSPIQNSSGIITTLLLLIIFREKLHPLAYLAIAMIFVGIIMVTIVETKDTREERRIMLKKKGVFLVILFPIIYCILDGLGTFIDSLYLDKFEIISEDVALVTYEYTFLIYAIISWIICKFKNEKITIKNDKFKWCAALFETAGQFTYVFAMAGDSTISAAIVGSYCVLAFLLGGIVLKEKLSTNQYIGITINLLGIILLSALNL